MCTGTNLKQWYQTLVSSSLNVVDFGHNSGKLVQNRQISSMAIILNTMNPSKSDN